VLEHARADQAAIGQAKFALAARKVLAGERVPNIPGETEFAVVAGIAQMPVSAVNSLAVYSGGMEQTMNIGKGDGKSDDRVAWLFLDLNSYFAACEQQENPALRGKPIIVVQMVTDTTCAFRGRAPVPSGKCSQS
jgi:hypothetical protein